MIHFIDWVLSMVTFALPPRELTQRPAEAVWVDSVVEVIPGAELEVDQPPSRFINDEISRAARRALDII